MMTRLQPPPLQTALLLAVNLLAIPCRADDVRIVPESLRGTAGHFRVGHTAEGRWWFVDPDGKPFLYRGVCGVNRAGTQGGRRAVPGPYADAVDAKYGYAESPDRFVAATLERLRSWNFNALGAWATQEFFNRGMPFTEIMEFAKVGPELRVPGVHLPDVFAPEWAEAIDAQAKLLCTPLRESRELVGYFTDNELGWGQPETDEIWGAPDAINRRGPTLLQACLAAPAETAAHAAAWKFVLDRHGNDFAAVAKAWGLKTPNREAFLTATREGLVVLSKGYGEDHAAFTRLFVRRYVQLCAEAIRKYDPNHLILGARFGAPPGGDVLAEFKNPWVDVVSANNYRPNMRERVEIYHGPAGMPVLIGEFAWASPPFSDPRHLPPEARADIHAHVRKAGPASLEGAFTHPALVGYTWYRWVQDAKDGIGYGLVDRSDQPVPLNIELVTASNARLEAIAAAHSGNSTTSGR
jgi:hypothetical protein